MLADIMRTPPRGTWAGDHGLNKHSRQPFLFASPRTTNLSLLPGGLWSQKKCTQPSPVMEVAHVRSQCLRCACGLDRMGAAVSARLEPCGKANGIVYFIPSCVKEKCITLASIV